MPWSHSGPLHLICNEEYQIGGSNPSQGSMKKLLFILPLLMTACGPDPVPEPSPSGCSSDQDCKGDRICRYGSCVDQSTVKPAPTSEPKACGTVTVNCNCGYMPYAEGTLANNSSCSSGKQQYQGCYGVGYCNTYYGTIPWRAVCAC